MKKTKFLCLFLAFAMLFGLGINAYAAETSSFDTRLNSAPAGYEAGLNASDSVVSEEAAFTVNVDGTATDIRLNSAPANYTPSTTRANAEQAVPDVPSTQIITRESALMPTGGGEYSYNPTYWNDEDNVYRSNCYGYALNLIATNTSDPYAGWLFQPGYKAGEEYTSLTTSAIIDAVEADMEVFGRTIRSSSYSERPGEDEYKIALVIADNDYHWYRQDSSGYWSHKPGLTDITNKDASGNLITDPRTCDRDYSYADYSTWGGYYIISRP